MSTLEGYPVDRRVLLGEAGGRMVDVDTVTVVWLTGDQHVQVAQPMADVIQAINDALKASTDPFYRTTLVNGRSVAIVATQIVAVSEHEG